MRVKVARYTQDNPASLIVEKLLTTELAMRERGRNELDENQFSKVVRTIKILFEKDILPGETIKVTEHDTNSVWTGKVLSVNIAVGDPKVWQTIKLERIVE